MDFCDTQIISSGGAPSVSVYLFFKEPRTIRYVFANLLVSIKLNERKVLDQKTLKFGEQ